MSTELDSGTEKVEQRVYAALEQWDQERHDADDRGSFGRLLFYVQEAFADREVPHLGAGPRREPILPHLMGPALPE